MPRIEYSAIVAAKAEPIWRTLKAFGDIADWHPSIASSRLDAGQKASEIGCLRQIVFEDGNHASERLLCVDDRTRVLAYALEESPLPVANYQLEIRVTSLDDRSGSIVAWHASFDDHAQAVERDTLLENIRTLIAAGHDGLATFVTTHS